jgi:mRNA-degrading endonuclease RelE of RelBE toxin-antitoxin system
MARGMAKGVAFTDQAKADIRALPQPIALQILRTIARFLESEKGDVKRLHGIEPPQFRLRLGDYRVRFHDLGDSIEILRVRHRKDAYR